MATCTMRMDGALIVGLDAQELETLRLHAGREGLSVTNAMAGLVKDVLHTKASEICQEEKEARLCPDAVMGMVEIGLTWPKSGPYAIFEEADKQFAASVLAMSLREVLCVILYKHGFERKHNVLEREDEGMGTGESSVS